jgi:hypothetical protein
MSNDAMTKIKEYVGDILEASDHSLTALQSPS